MPAVARGFLLFLFWLLREVLLQLKPELLQRSPVQRMRFSPFRLRHLRTAKDVQVRYFLTDESGVRWSSTAAAAGSDKLVIHADSAGKTPKTFNAIAYAPGCQFVTFTAEDLASSTRQGDFQCQKLPTVELRGKVALPAGGQVTASGINVCGALGGKILFRSRPLNFASCRDQGHGGCGRKFRDGLARLRQRSAVEHAIE